MLIIKEEYHLNALLKALWKLKFDSPAEEVAMFSGSPFIADIYNDAYNAYLVVLRNSGKSGYAERLEQERLAENRTIEIQVVREQIRIIQKEWVKWDNHQREQFIRIALSPFTASDDLIISLIAEVTSD